MMVMMAMVVVMSVVMVGVIMVMVVMMCHKNRLLIEQIIVQRASYSTLWFRLVPS